MRRGLDSLGQDLGYGIRSFRRSPAFTLVALLSLTLGIGATTAIFSVIYGVLIAPYPYARPGEIWSPEVRAIDGRGGRPYRPDELRALAQIPAFSDVMATSFDTVLMTGEFAPESFGGAVVDRQCVQLSGCAAGGRPHDSAVGHPRRRAGRTGRGLELQAVAPTFRRQPGGCGPGSRPEWPSSHDPRRHAAAFWLVRERQLLAAARARENRFTVRQSHHAPRDRCVEEGRR